MVDYKGVSDAYESLSSRLIIQAGEIGRNTFLNLGNWRDDDKAIFVQSIVANLDATKREAAELAYGYHREIAILNQRNFSLPKYDAADFTTDALRKKSAETVYSRPFVDMRTQLAKGETFSNALEAGARRSQSLAQTEAQLARRNASLVARKKNDNIVGYLRVLSGSENCALCYVASTQRYNSGDLMPIHPGCDCGELPIYGDTDVGQVIDQQRLDAAHEQVRERLGGFDAGGREPDYRNIMTREHGELGPVLAVRGQKFTGPKNLNLKGTTTKRLADAPVPLIESVERGARVTSMRAWSSQVDEFRRKNLEDNNYSYAFRGEGGNVVLSDIAEKQGFRGKPALVNSVDELDDERIFRVVKDDVQTRQVRNPNFDITQNSSVDNPLYLNEVVSSTDAKKFVDQIKTGDVPYYGHGLYGDGMYFGNNLDNLAEYAGGLSIAEATKVGNVVKASISPNAKLFRASSPSDFRKKVQELAEKAAKEFGTDFDNPFVSMTKSISTGKFDVESDQISRLFAMEGYDGYQVPKVGFNKATGAQEIVEGEVYSVIINRTILKVVK